MRGLGNLRKNNFPVFFKICTSYPLHTFNLICSCGQLFIIFRAKKIASLTWYHPPESISAPLNYPVRPYFGPKWQEIVDEIYHNSSFLWPNEIYYVPKCLPPSSTYFTIYHLVQNINFGCFQRSNEVKRSISWVILIFEFNAKYELNWTFA